MRRAAQWSGRQEEFIAGAEAARLLAWVTEADGYCVYLSPRWHEFTGHAPGQAEGFGWLDAIHTQDRARVSEAFFTATGRQVPYGVDYRIFSHDGTPWPAWAYGAPHRDGSGAFQGFLGVTNVLPEIVLGDTPDDAPADLRRADPEGEGRGRILTEREREALTYVAAGFSAEEIAGRLGIAARTVHSHVQSAIWRLGARNRTHACITALQLNEIAVPGAAS